MKLLMKLLITITITIIVLFLIYFKISKSNFEGNLYNGEKWNNYRLGDVYLHADKTEHPFQDLNYHKIDYPGSIAAELLNITPYKPKNKKLLLKIISQKQKIKTIDTDLILHIRVGDVLCLYDKTKTWYSRKDDFEWWDDVLGYILKNNIKRVYIVAGTHFKDCIKESEDYLDNRKKFLIENIPGIDIVYRLGKSPDDDFILFINARHFISTGGGFGRIVYEINNKFSDFE